MDYEKKYNDALAEMKVIYPNLNGDAKKAVEHAFPELADSEDERTRKELVEFITTIKDISESGRRELAICTILKRNNSLNQLNLFLNVQRIG